MKKRRFLTFFLAALAGLLFACWSLFLSFGLIGAGHRPFLMPEKALHAPGHWYLFAWPVIMPLSLVRLRTVRWVVRCVVGLQTLMAMVLLCSPAGIADLVKALSHGNEVAFAVYQLLFIYAVVNGSSLLMAFIPLPRNQSGPAKPASIPGFASRGRGKNG